jgi:hypothetical protein
MPETLVVKQSMVPVPITATVEAMEAHIQTRVIVLEIKVISHIPEMELKEHTIESKHCVQSSR